MELGFRVFGQAAKWLFIVSLPVLFISASIAGWFNSFPLYNYGFTEYQVSQATGLPPAELQRTARGLISYFNSSDEYISLEVTNNQGRTFELFTTEEKEHFKDVKGLVRLDYNLLIGTGIYALVYAALCLTWQRREHWHRLGSGLLIGSGITLGGVVALVVASFVDFNQLFLLFHQISFSNEFWSTPGYMLLLFPGDFWFDAMLAVLVSVVVGAFMLGGIGGYLMWHYHPQHLRRY
jgi:integral membrane protein (TIGR01906 family)